MDCVNLLPKELVQSVLLSSKISLLCLPSLFSSTFVFPISLMWQEKMCLIPHRSSFSTRPLKTPLLSFPRALLAYRKQVAQLPASVLS